MMNVIVFLTFAFFTFFDAHFIVLEQFSGTASCTKFTVDIASDQIELSILESPDGLDVAMSMDLLEQASWKTNGVILVLDLGQPQPADFGAEFVAGSFFGLSPSAGIVYSWSLNARRDQLRLLVTRDDCTEVYGSSEVGHLSLSNFTGNPTQISVLAGGIVVIDNLDPF